MTIVVRRLDTYVLNMRTRMPFRYGIASMTVAPHLFVRVELAAAGRPAVGVAAEGLPPKWFTKDPHTSFAADLADMLRVIRSAQDVARGLRDAPTVFDFWRRLYAEQERWATPLGYPPLLWNLGVSLVERAVLDAFCRATGVPFAAAARTNTLGVRLGDVHPELAGSQPADLLPARPLPSVLVRHTVGLADPLRDDEIPAGERLDDGLPQSLAACVGAYGLTHFKLKLRGDAAWDTARLARIAAVVDAAAGGPCAFTLDGNEQYPTVEAFRAFWRALAGDPSLAPLRRRVLFVEQPLPRDVALTPAAGAALRAWDERPPLVIDESDGDLGSLPAALAGGYAGTSHKNCKGIFKGLANACLLAHRRRADPRGRYLLTGEDLANVGPVALLQDLSAMATLGVRHVERNGHHYFAGLSMLPPDVQEQVLAAHGDLYRRHPRGFPTLDIRGGRIAVGSAVAAPFGVGFPFDPRRFTPLEAWDSASLEASPAAQVSAALAMPT
jgi:hypothetical protein